MQPLKITIDDASPLIEYSPTDAWNQTSSNDAYGGGYSSTYTQNAVATFEFEGTWVAVKGSQNTYHGAYNVTLDGYLHSFNGSTSQSTLFNNAIFNSGPIGEGHHFLTITNLGWTTLDIDSITWSCGVGARNVSETSLKTITVDDTDQAFTYAPHGTWDMNPPNVHSFSQKTGHSTSLAQASVNYTFTGDAVSIYGTTGPNNSRYSVQRPGHPPREFTATRGMQMSKVLLYFGDQFGPGNHSVTLVNETPGLFQIDYAVVHAVDFSSPNSNTTSTASPSGTPVIPVDSHSRSRLPAGVIVAITFTAFAFLFLAAALWFLLRRNKTLWMRLQRGYMVQSQFDAATPPNGAITPLPYTTPTPQAARSKAAYFPANDDESFEAPALNRAVTTQSTASTLVADHGSYMTQIGYNRRLSLKPLRLASRWGPGTPSSSQAHFSRHFSRSPSAQHLLREESEYYDPEAARGPGIEEVSEDRVNDILRHPIRRNEPSTHQWQSSLP